MFIDSAGLDYQCLDIGLLLRCIEAAGLITYMHMHLISIQPTIISIHLHAITCTSVITVALIWPFETEPTCQLDPAPMLGFCLLGAEKILNFNSFTGATRVSPVPAGSDTHTHL